VASADLQARTREIMRSVKATTAPAAAPTTTGQGPGFISPGPSPLVASYGEWTSGRSMGIVQSLPRDPRTFLSGMFGPLTPLQVVPVDTPQPGDDRAEPRRFQYPVGWDMPQGMPGTEGLGKLADFTTLRTLADLYSVARACIDLRKAELRGIGWDIVLTKNAAKALRGSSSGMQDFAKRRAQAIEFWRRPDPYYPDFSSWFDTMLEEVFVTDALALYVQPARGQGKGVLGSSLGALDLIDGTLIRPLVDIRGGKPTPPNPAYQQYLYGVPRVDLMTLLLGEDNPEEQGLVAEYAGDQLMYLPFNQRTWTPYGQTPVERAIIPIMTGLNRQQYQLNYYQEGSIPGLFVSPGDPNMTPAQIRELQDALNALAGDQAWKHKIIVLPGGSRVDPQKPASLADQFDEIMMTQVCTIPDMEVITRSGLIPIKDVQIGELVLTHAGRWRPVTKVMRNPVHEPVRTIQANGFDPLEVTGNHPVWAARYSMSKTHKTSYTHTEWVAARDVRAKAATGSFDALTLPVPVPGSADARLRLADHVHGHGWWLREQDGMLVHSNPRVTPLPATVPMGAAFGRLLGLYMAEGSTTNGQTAWYFHENEVAYQQHVIDDLQSLFGLTAKLKPVDGEKCTAVVCNSALLGELFSCGTARTKTLPAWAWDGSAEFYASLLWGWVSGDGSLTNTGWRGYTSSRTLAWQMRLVALACGLEPQFRTQKQTKSSIGGRELRGSDVIYVVQAVLDKQKTGTYRIDGPHLTSAVRSNAASAYDGDVVYNLEVADDHSYVTTGGTVHNCMAFQVMPMELGISPRVSSTQSTGAANQMAKASQDIQERKGVVPLLLWLKSAIFDRVLQGICGQDDMEWQWEGLEEDEDAETLTNLLVQQVSAGMRSIDEARQELGLDPWNLPITSDPGWATQMGGFVSFTVPPPAPPALPGQPPPPGQPQGQQQPPKPPSKPGQVQPPQNKPPTALTAPRKPPAGDVTGGGTPAHAASGATPDAAPNKPAGTSASKAQLRELSLLRSHLRRGGDLDSWQSRDLPGYMLAIIAEDLTKGLDVDQVIGGARDLIAKGHTDVTPVHGHGDLTHEVYAYLARHYPATVLEWVKEARWTGPHAVPLARINMARRPGGARNEAKVQAIRQHVEDGGHLDPVVLVQVPGQAKYEIADGWHRTAGVRDAGGTTIRAWIGRVDTSSGPWDQAMNEAKLNKAGAGMLIRHTPPGGQTRYLLQRHSATSAHPGTWDNPGGHLHDGETPTMGAVRETVEELGHLPKDLITRHMVSGQRDGEPYHTVICDSPAQFTPAQDGATPDETADWGWFTQAEIAALDTHPAFTLVGPATGPAV
jgi:8-oxo-dGTP pyrophosphatase MutT (NUDIX family)